MVTIGVAFILFTLATAGVKGFAFTLGVGTIMSLFTAVLATSAILGSMSRTRMMGSRLAIGAGKRHGGGWKFDFVGRSKWFFSMSGLILVAGALAIAGLGINFGIDFESGTRIKTPVERTASVDDVRARSRSVGLGRLRRSRRSTSPSSARTSSRSPPPRSSRQKVNEVRTALDNDFGVEQADFSSNSIGPTFGAQIARTALIAIIASLILISIYIALRFEAKFAVPVLIALSHDILITSGVYALLDREVTTSTVAALLTILGYSLYDTIIVFDRIRENVPRMPRATFSQIVNRSMSEVLTRSLATSFCTLLPVSALMLFGGETLRDFAFALLVGIASGAYSSIFIAAPVLTLWKEREPVYVRRRKIVLEENGGIVPPFSTGSLGDGGGPEPDGDGDGRGRGGPRGGPQGSRACRRRRSPRSRAAAPPAPKPATTTRRAADERPRRAAASPPAPDAEAQGRPTGDGGDGKPPVLQQHGRRRGRSSKPKPKKSTSRPRKKHGRR